MRICSATTSTDVRARRQQLGVSRLTLAILSRVSISWLAAIEGGMRPRSSQALSRVLATLDRFDTEQTGATLRNAYGKPTRGDAEHLAVVSAYRGDTDGPEEAA